MLTREQIEEIRADNREKGISIKNLLKEKGIPESQYFWWKRKYSKPDAPRTRSVFFKSGNSRAVPCTVTIIDYLYEFILNLWNE